MKQSRPLRRKSRRRGGPGPRETATVDGALAEAAAAPGRKVLLAHPAQGRVLLYPPRSRGRRPRWPRRTLMPGHSHSTWWATRLSIPPPPCTMVRILSCSHLCLRNSGRIPVRRYTSSRISCLCDDVSCVLHCSRPPAAAWSSASSKLSAPSPDATEDSWPQIVCLYNLVNRWA